MALFKCALCQTFIQQLQITLIVCHKVKVTPGLELDKKSFADLSLQMMWGGASAQTVYTLIACHKVKVTTGLKLDKTRQSKLCGF